MPLMGVGGGSGIGGSRWPLGALAGVVALIGVVWLLGWRGKPPDQSTTTWPVTATTGPSTTAAADPDSGRIDIMGVVVAVEPGAEWTIAPIGICPRPDLGPHPEGCPPIGPATLVLNSGARLTVPAGTPGDPLLWDMAQAGDEAEEAFIIAGLQDEWTVEWVYVIQAGDLPRLIDLDAGEIGLITADGRAVTAFGWKYKLSGTLRTTGCAHLLPWTLVGPVPEAGAEWMTVSDLASIWDGSTATRLDIAPVGRATARTITALTCTDLLAWRGDPDPLGTLAEARALWFVHSEGDYRFRWSSTGAQGGEGTWDITVTNGEAAAILVTAPSGTPEDQPFRIPTIDGLFADMRAALTAQPGDGPGLPCTDPKYWTARYEPNEGYPTSFAFDSPACNDEEQSWRVEWLQRLYQGLLMCRGWDADPQTGMTLLYSPYPIWQGGDSLDVGATWRYEITLDGCDFQFLHFNGTWWKQVSRAYEPGTTGDGGELTPGSYPPEWAACVLPVASGPLVQVYGHIRLIDAETIEARTLAGSLIATYAPTTEEPPCVTD
jgi:hypothetical protein